MQHDLFAADQHQTTVKFDTQAFVLKGFAEARAEALWHAVQEVLAVSPWRQLSTPGGKQMSVRTTNCGAWGWHSDRQGYRYTSVDPLNDQPWPVMPQIFSELAQEAAVKAGFANFKPDACLINSYLPGTKMGLHQDKDEEDKAEPIVSVSLGLSAQFMWGGRRRTDKPQRIELQHGDVVVWGGEDRLNFHGIGKIIAGDHPLLGQQRINLTLRKAK